MESNNKGNEKPVQNEEEGNQENVEHVTWRSIINEYWEIFSDVIDLREGLDRYGTILSIRKNIRLKGINVWLLICAIVIASIGLDKNSVAVIIGGMLISPLMYPILGIGLAIAMNDRVTLVKSIENFSVAVLVTLVTSTIYFALTPYGYETVEIASRTQPDIIDVFVGFFGGIAGIVAGSRKDISSAIPGVAIATALLPPICVAGYGLAKFDFTIFGGAFYLFLLNAFFIMIATYLVVRYLKFPVKQHTTRAQQRRSRLAMIAAVVVIIIPSFFFLRGSIIDIRENNYARSFVEENFENNQHINMIDWEYEQFDTLKVLECTFQIDDKFNAEQTDSLEDVLNAQRFHKNTILRLRQIEATEDEIQELRSDNEARQSEWEKQMEQVTALLNEKDIEIEQLEDDIKEAQSDSLIFTKMKEMLKIWYPDLDEIYVGEVWHTDYERENNQMLLMLDWGKTLYRSELARRTEKISAYVLAEYEQLDTVFIQHK